MARIIQRAKNSGKPAIGLLGVFLVASLAGSEARAQSQVLNSGFSYNAATGEDPGGDSLFPAEKNGYLLHAATGDPGLGAQNFVQGMAERALGFLGNASLTQAQKEASFRKLLEDSFDLETIGRFTLGRYWRTSNEQQRTEYQKLFREMVVDVYVKRFDEYTGEKFEARSYRNDGDKDTIVTSFLIPTNGGPEVEIDWRVRYKNGRYQIVDVLVEGVSMSVTQRADFAAVIQRGGGDVQVLLAYLKGQ